MTEAQADSLILLGQLNLEAIKFAIGVAFGVFISSSMIRIMRISYTKV